MFCIFIPFFLILFEIKSIQSTSFALKRAKYRTKLLDRDVRFCLNEPDKCK